MLCVCFCKEARILPLSSYEDLMSKVWAKVNQEPVPLQRLRKPELHDVYLHWFLFFTVP